MAALPCGAENNRRNGFGNSGITAVLFQGQVFPEEPLSVQKATLKFLPT